MSIWFMDIACWVTKAIHTHSQYVFIITFPLHKWLHETPQCYIIRTLTILFILTICERNPLIVCKYLLS
jgi:hypothetical protein